MSPKGNKVKLTIKLTSEQSEGYPVDTESLWFLKEGEFHRLINIPFFIDGISMEDLVSLKSVGDSLFKVEDVIYASGNSTIWVTINKDEEGNMFLKDIHKLGCGYEGGVFHGYFSINVPKEVNMKSVYNLLDKAEKDDILLCDYSNIVHGR